MRAASNWEPPRFELTRFMRQELQLTDAWEATGRAGPLGTCRFDTRIDYIMADRAALETGRLCLLRCDTTATTATDHNLVACDLVVSAS